MRLVGLVAEAVPAAGQGTRLVGELAHQRGHVDVLLDDGRLLRLQARQHQQILDEPMHPAGLLMHQLQVVTPHRVACGIGRIEQHLEETVDHRERRAQFVRDVGHEVAPHGVDSLGLRHIVGQHDRARRLELDHGDRERERRRVQRPEHQRLLEAARGHESDEGRVAHQVGQAQAAVVPQRQAEVPLGHRIAPFDLQGGVDQHDALGERADGAAEAFLVLGQPALRQLAGAVGAIQPAEHFGPGADTFGHGLDGRALEPVGQQAEVDQMEREQHRQRKHREDQPHRGVEEHAEQHGDDAEGANAQQRRQQQRHAQVWLPGHGRRVYRRRAARRQLSLRIESR